MDHLHYKYVGRLEDFQDLKYKILQFDYDITHLRETLGIDDEFAYYLVEIGDGEYLRVFGVTGIHLSSFVYEYELI